MLPKFTAPYLPRFYAFSLSSSHSNNNLPQYQVMTGTGNCHFLRPLPLRPPKALFSWLTCLFLPLTFPCQRSIWVVGIQFSISCPHPAGLLPVRSSPAILGEAYESSLHLASQNWCVACQKPSQVGQCTKDRLPNWLISLFPTNFIFKSNITFFCSQDFNISISFCNTTTKDNSSPVWTGRSFP